MIAVRMGVAVLPKRRKSRPWLVGIGWSGEYRGVLTDLGFGHGDGTGGQRRVTPSPGNSTGRPTTLTLRVFGKARTFPTRQGFFRSLKVCRSPPVFAS